jgi:hypothetical protein
MCAGDVPRSGGLGAREELMQSRGLTRSGFRWRPTNWRSVTAHLADSAYRFKNTGGSRDTYGTHGRTRAHGSHRLPYRVCPGSPRDLHRLNRSHGTNQLQTTLSAVRCAAERCLDDDVLFRIPAMRGLAPPSALLPPSGRVSELSAGGGRTGTHSHNGSHKSSPHYMRACVRHTHPVAINCIPFGRRRPWKVLEERPRSRGEPSRAWPRAHHVALVSLFDGTQRRSRPARARHGARLTPQ